MSLALPAGREVAEYQVKDSQRKYADGEIIFEEGDPSHSAFVIVEGAVDLSKSGEGGPLMMARLEPGEFFGETGVIDQSPRASTARAVGTVVLKVISRHAFLDALQKKPETALTVMAQLVGRRGAPNGKAPAPAARTKTAKRAARKSKPGLISRFLERRQRARATRIEIRVATLAGDIEATNTQQVVAALNKRHGIKVKRLPHTLEMDPFEDPATHLTVVAATARKWLADADADLLIWGEIPEPGTTLHLRFVSAVPEDDDRPGTFGLAIRLNLPVGFGAEFGHVLLAAALAALTPDTLGKSLRLRDILPKALDAAAPAVQELPHDLTSRERAAVRACFGNVASTVAVQQGAIELYQVAAQSYRAALEILSREETPVEWAITQKNLGVALQAIGDRTSDAETLDAATDCYNNALKVLTRHQFPGAWATLQNRLGLVLYKLDLETGDTELVKHALSSFQSALQVFTRAEWPLRWADVMSNFAQAAQMLGGQLRSTEVLKKSVEACRGVLEVRTKEKSPLLWAATQNNLGSALFLLGRVTQDAAYVEGAAVAFGRALDTYNAHGAERMAALTRKNLARAENLLGDRASRDGARPPREPADAEDSAPDGSNGH